MKRPNDIKRPNSKSGSFGRFLRSRQKMVHVSAEARMRDNPLGMLHPMIAWVQKPGNTYNVGRRAAKAIIATWKAANKLARKSA